jgi:hypothetical protein
MLPGTTSAVGDSNGSAAERKKFLTAKYAGGLFNNRGGSQLEADLAKVGM